MQILELQTYYFPIKLEIKSKSKSQIKKIFSAYLLVIDLEMKLLVKYLFSECVGTLLAELKLKSMLPTSHSLSFSPGVVLSKEDSSKNQGPKLRSLYCIV